MKLLEILQEAVDLQHYVWQWLFTGERSVNRKIPHSFLLTLEKQGYKKHGTIYRSISISKEDFNANYKPTDWKNFIWENYRGSYTSFTKTEQGADWFAGAMSMKDDAIHIIIKQRSNYIDIYQYFIDNKEYFEPLHGYDDIAGELDVTRECVATLSPDFQVFKIFRA